MLTYWETLIATRSNIAVNDSYAALWGKKSQNNYTVETYTGTLPATLQTIEGYLESYKIYGNTVQDGTPTPENPIMPSGCGERTENLFDKSSDVVGYYISSINGVWTQTGSTSRSIIIKCKPNTTYTIFVPTNRTLRAAYFYNYPSVGDIGYGYTASTTGDYVNKKMTITTNSSAQYLAFFCYDSLQEAMMYDEAEYFSQIMLNEGSTALPYEPYGYKLPLAVNGEECPIYLGKVETTRKVKKLVLTGEENFMKNSTAPSNYLYYAPRNSVMPSSIEKTPLMCDELPATSEAPVFQIGASANNPYNVIYINFGADVMNAQSSGNTVNGFKEYLAAQYTAGTPVTVWYVLAKPETGIVNEPLMKIGEYADTVSMEQAGVSIPTFADSTTISWAGEGLAPSEVELIYKVKR